MQYASVKGHLGNNYIVAVDEGEDTEWIEEMCETCFDYDRVIGVFDTAKEAEQLLK